MTLNCLYYFTEICKELSISRTALRLYTTQQCLSNAVSRLERELGCKLFLRTTGGVTLTPAGKYLLQQSTKILALTDDIKNHIGDFNHDGEFHILLPEGLSMVLLPHLPVRYQDYVIAYTEAGEQKCIDYLRDGLCDASILASPGGRPADAEPIYREPYYAVLSAQDPLGVDAVLSVSALACMKEYTLLLNEHIPQANASMLQVLQNYGVSFRSRKTAVFPFSAFQACTSNNAVAFFPKSIAASIRYPGVRILPTAIPELTIDFYLRTGSEFPDGVSAALFKHLQACMASPHRDDAPSAPAGRDVVAQGACIPCAASGINGSDRATSGE